MSFAWTGPAPAILTSAREYGSRIARNDHLRRAVRGSDHENCRDADRVRPTHRPGQMVTPPDTDEARTGAGPSRPGRRGLHPSPGARSCSRCAGKHRLEAARPAAHRVHARGDAHLARGQPEARRAAPASTPAQIYLQAKRDLAITRDEIPQLRHLSERLRARNEHAPGPGRRGAAVPHLLRVHRRARLPGDAVHPPRLAPGVHARAGHDPRLPRPRPAADEPGLRRAAHAHRQGRRDHDRTATRCWP